MVATLATFKPSSNISNPVISKSLQRILKAPHRTLEQLLGTPQRRILVVQLRTLDIRQRPIPTALHHTLGLQLAILRRPIHMAQVHTLEPRLTPLRMDRILELRPTTLEPLLPMLVPPLHHLQRMMRRRHHRLRMGLPRHRLLALERLFLISAHLVAHLPSHLEVHHEYSLNSS